MVFYRGYKVLIILGEWHEQTRIPVQHDSCDQQKNKPQYLLREVEEAVATLLKILDNCRKARTKFGRIDRWQIQYMHQGRSPYTTHLSKKINK